VQALEAFINVRLFDRHDNRMTLTNQGLRYLAEVEPALNTIRRVTASLNSERIDGPVRIIAPQTLVINWLAPNLPQFIEMVGGADFEIKVSHDLANLFRGLAELAIVLGPVTNPDLEVDVILELEGVVASAPVMLHGRQPPTSLSEMPAYPRFDLFYPPRLWSTWLTNVGVDDMELPKAIRHRSMTTILELAAAGFGLALTPLAVANRLFKEGRLVPCFDERALIGLNFSVVYADTTVRRRRDVVTFVDWFRREVTKAQTLNF
jgi:LysR family glycine cleavage system transcriptional activator